MSRSALPLFSSKSFIVSGLTFKFVTQFEFIFVCGVRRCYSLIHLHLAVQFSKYHLLKRLSLLHCVFLPPLSKIRFLQVHGFISGLLSYSIVLLLLFLCQYHTVLITVAL